MTMEPGAVFRVDHIELPSGNDSCCDCLRVTAAAVFRVAAMTFLIITWPIRALVVFLVNGFRSLCCSENDGGGRAPPFIPPEERADREIPEWVRRQENEQGQNQLQNNAEQAARLPTPAPDAMHSVRFGLPQDARLILEEFGITERKFLKALELSGQKLTTFIIDSIRARDLSMIVDLMAILPEDYEELPVPVSRPLSLPRQPSVAASNQAQQVADAEQIPERVALFLRRYDYRNFVVDPRHLNAIEMNIPEANPEITMDQFLIFFEEMRAAGKLPRKFDDDGRVRNPEEFLNLFRQKVTNLADFRQTAKDHYGNVLPAEKRKAIVNILRHLIATFTAKQQEILRMEPGRAKTAAENLYYADLGRAVKEIGSGFYHCKDRLSTLYEDIYYAHVLPYSSPDLRNVDSYEFLVLLALCQFRKDLFDNATSVPGDNESAPTQKYWRREVGRQYGIASPLCDNERQYDGYATKAGIREKIETAFREEYCVYGRRDIQNPRTRAMVSQPYGILQYLIGKTTNPLEESLNAARTMAWMERSVPNWMEDRGEYLNEDGTFKKELYVFLLEKCGVIKRR